MEQPSKYDARLHLFLASGPQHPPADGTDGYCEHWITESDSTVKGHREGDRDCRTPAVFVFERRVGGKVVNRFRSCREHRPFIVSVERGWHESGLHPHYEAATA